MKTALITGIGRGIGEALAKRFMAESWSVIGTSRSGDVGYAHDHAVIYRLDLADEASIRSCVRAIADAGHKIDVLINNAGVLEDEEETRVVIDKLRKTLEVNLIGTIGFTEGIIPIMSEGGHIVNISSQAGSLADADNVEDSHYPYHYPAYKISKCALNMYTRTLANRLRHEGADIIVSSVHPGWVRTEMGGADAPTLPEEAAADIYNLAASKPETGRFWYKGQAYPW